jgi:hypothetical protein
VQNLAVGPVLVGPSARSAKSSYRPSARRRPSVPGRVERGNGGISLLKDALARGGARSGLYGAGGSPSGSPSSPPPTPSLLHTSDAEDCPDGRPQRLSILLASDH